MVFLELPPNPDVSMVHAFDRQTAPRVERLREHLVQQLSDRLSSHDRSRHGCPLAGRSGALVLDGTAVRSIVEFQDFPYKPRRASLAFSSFCLRVLERPLPPRLMKNVSIDMAERYEFDLRLRLRSAERLSDWAIWRGVDLVNTPFSSVSASLSRVT